MQPRKSEAKEASQVTQSQKLQNNFHATEKILPYLVSTPFKFSASHAIYKAFLQPVNHTACFLP